MVQCPEPTLQQFFLKMSSSKVFLCTSTSQGSSSARVSRVMHTHRELTQCFPQYTPALGTCEAQKDTSSPTLATAAAQRGHCSSAPLGGQRDTCRGWAKSHSSAPSFAPRSLRNADSTQAKNRAEGTPLETCAHAALLVTVC